MSSRDTSDSIALRATGALAFSVEKQTDLEARKVGAGMPYRLDRSGRYQHSPSYLRTILAQTNFDIELLREVVLRSELRRPVPGFLVLAKRRL